MENQDIRWEQRFANFNRALANLEGDVGQSRVREFSKLENQGLIQGFEYTYELAWKVIKDYLTYQGDQNITGSRDAFRAVVAAGILSDGRTWMAMIESRNESSHAYDESIANEIVNKIRGIYLELFQQLRATLEGKRSGGQMEI